MSGTRLGARLGVAAFTLAVGLVLGPSVARCDGLPRVNGYINGEPVRFIVDTGASEISVPHQIALKLGLDFQGRQQAEYVTAGGRINGYRLTLESVKVSNMEVLAVPAHVTLEDRGPDEILLGMSFLRHVTLTVHNGTVSILP